MLKIKKIKPVFTGILTTTDKYENDVVIDGIIQNVAGRVKEYQKVLAVGDTIRNIKVGDLIMIDPTNYTRKKYDSNSIREDMVDNPVISINIPTYEVDGKECFLIQDRDVKFIIEDYEEIPDKKPKKTKTIILPRNKIIS